MTDIRKPNNHGNMAMLGAGLVLGLLVGAMAVCTILGDAGKEPMRWLALFLVALGCIVAYLLVEPDKASRPLEGEMSASNSQNLYNLKMAFVFMLGLTTLAMWIDKDKTVADLLLMTGGVLGGVAFSRIKLPLSTQQKSDTPEGTSPQ